MEKLKHSKIGIISFLLALIPIIYVVIQTIVDIAAPMNTDFNIGLATSYYIINLMFAISLVRLVLGIFAITQKGYKKGFPISSVVISGLILLIPIIMFSEIIIEIFNK